MKNDLINLGTRIKYLRNKKRITQQDLADKMNVSIQIVSRWENGINYPDIMILPSIASFFNVTTDYLLGMEGEKLMAKLLKTTEKFELTTIEEAKKMIKTFQLELFPKLKSYEIKEMNNKILLIVEKEFGVEFDKMEF